MVIVKFKKSEGDILDNNDNNKANELNDTQPLPPIGSEIKPSASEQPGLSSSPEPIPQPVNPPQVTAAPSPISAPTDDPTPNPGSAPAAGPVMPQAAPHPSQPGGKSAKRRNMVFAGVVAAFLLVGGSAAAYVGLYLPNQPENIWKTALSNTAKGYDKLVEYEQEHKDLKTSKLEGNYRVESEGQAFDGKYSVEADDKYTKAYFDIGVLGNRVSVDLLGEFVDTSPYPDVYARANGIDAFESMFAGSGAEGLPTGINNQWYSIDHSLFDQALTNAESEQTDIDPEDVRELLRTFGEVNREYLFTTDAEKAVLNNQEYVGSEEQDGRKVHRYKVGLRKEQLKAYAEKLTNEIRQSDLYKSISPDEDEIDTKSMLESIDKIDESKTVDVWVDSGTKLIRTVRFTFEGQPDDYLDIGLKYIGGNEFPFYIKGYAVEDDSVATNIDLSLTLNTDNDTVKIEGNVNTSDEAFKATLTGLMTRSNESVEFERPSDARPAMDLIQMIMGGGVPLGDSTGQPSPFQISTD